MLTTIVGIVGVAISALGLWLKYLRPKPSVAQQTEETSRAMLQAAVDRPDDDAATRRLLDGDA